MRITKPAVLLTLTLFGSVVFGAISTTYQEERRISGKVTDDSGAPVPNCSVILEYAPFGTPKPWTEIGRTATSETGDYKFSARGTDELPWGNYRLTFTAPGWDDISRTTYLGQSGAEHRAVLVQVINVQVPRDWIAGPRVSAGLPRLSPQPERSARANRPIDTPSPTSATPTPEPRPTPEATATPRRSSSNANVSTNTNTSANANVSANTNTSPRRAEPTSSEIDQILKSLDLGTIAFNTPKSMSLIDAKKVELLLSTSLSDEALRNAVAQHNVEGKIEVEEIKISDQMEANLTGDGFQITEVLPARRPISKAGPTEWTWDVRALKEGTLRLHLTLNALVTVKGNQQLYPIRTFDKDYVVSVGMTEKVVSFAKDNWKWLWTTLGVPLGAWLLKRKRKSGEVPA
jgi:hypothetical protein